jgi:hypothetical protein
MTAAFTQDNNRFVPDLCLADDTRLGAQAPETADRLAALARISLTGAAPAQGLPGLRRPEAEALAALAIRTRMTGACSRAYTIADAPMPPPLAEAVRNARARAAVNNGRVLGLARIAFPLLDRSAIRAIAFKGPFQHRQIHGDPFFCRSGDLDLLVSRDDFAPALTLFERAGFVRRGDTSPWWTSALGEVHLVHGEGGVIDLHHRLQQPGSPPPRDIAQFLNQSRRERLGGVEIAFPGLPHTVLICALNFVKEFAHRKLSARYAYDVAAGLMALAAREQMPAFAAAVARQKLSGTVRFAAALAGRIFGIDLPTGSLAPDRPLPEWASREAVLAMAFAPDAASTPWPRRRAVLWALCSDDGAARRAAEFSREQVRILASEALRRAAGARAA